MSPLRPIPIPGLFVTATDTEVGKTVIAGAIAHALLRQGVRVAVSKPVATGCVRRREGLVSEDAEFLASCADSPHTLDDICPQRYREPLAPAVAADRAQQPLDWSAIDASLQHVSRDRDLIIVEGVGGILVPLDAHRTTLDLARWLNLPTVIVARPNLGTINHTLMTIETLRRARVPIAGVVINRYPSDTPGTAEETSPRYIERHGKVPILTIVPDAPPFKHPPLPATITTAITRVDWPAFARRER